MSPFQSHLLTISSILIVVPPLPPSLQTESTKGFIKGVLQSRKGGETSQCDEKDGRRREGETAGEKAGRGSRFQLPTGLNPDDLQNKKTSMRPVELGKLEKELTSAPSLLISLRPRKDPLFLLRPLGSVW